MFLDDTRLQPGVAEPDEILKRRRYFDVDRFKAAVEIFITAQEILVDNASYPTERRSPRTATFTARSGSVTPISAALLMSRACPTTATKDAAMAASITAIMHCHAYTQSARIAQPTWARSRLTRRIASRCCKSSKCTATRLATIHGSCPEYLRDAAQACRRGGGGARPSLGYRNAQVTVLAPTGTIGS